MKVQIARPLRIVIFMIIGLLIISCSLSNTNSSAPTPTQTSQPIVQETKIEIPTLAPFVTNTSMATLPPPPTEVPTVALPTEAPTIVLPTETLAAPDFFTEEFDGDLSNWEYFFTSGNEEKTSFYTEDGKLKFYLNDKYIYLYLLYAPYTYKNTVLTAVVENRGYNDNNISLICRYDPQDGWYEFNVTSGGLYQILVYDKRDKHYKLIADGGSTAIHTGRDINEYAAVCNDRTLTLYINGVEARSVKENTYVLREGQVGISVSSFDSYPIEVEVESFKIDYPR